LFGWLTTLYPVWARLTPEDVAAASAVALAELALTGCTTAADHHYLVPGGDDSVFDAIAGAARTIGIRVHIARGSMDLGESAGGLPPDSVVEGRDAILAMYGRLFEETAGTLKVALEATYAAGNNVVAIYRGTATRNGRTLDQRNALVFEIERGQAVRLTDLPEDLDAANGFWS